MVLCEWLSWCLKLPLELVVVLDMLKLRLSLFGILGRCQSTVFPRPGGNRRNELKVYLQRLRPESSSNMRIIPRKCSSERRIEEKETWWSVAHGMSTYALTYVPLMIFHVYVLYVFVASLRYTRTWNLKLTLNFVNLLLLHYESSLMRINVLVALWAHQDQWTDHIEA